VRVEGKEERKGSYAMGGKRKRVVRWGDGGGKKQGKTHQIIQRHRPVVSIIED
jgi:hypothetical protein